MKRKILQAGPATLTVSLPMSWVKKYHLKKGQELEVEEQGSSIRIKTDSQMIEDIAEVNVSELSPISTKIIGTLYKAGFKKIKAYYTPNRVVIHRGRQVKELDMIKHTFDHLNGMQLWELGKDNGENFALVIESAKVDPQEFKNFLDKIFLHLISQSELVTVSLKEKKDIFDESFLEERLINQTADFCTKILVSFGHEEHKKTIHYYDLINNLESIGDSLFKISLELKETKKYHKNIIPFLEEITELLKETESIYRKFDLNKISLFTKKLSALITEYEIKIKSKDIDGIHSYSVYNIMNELSELIEVFCFLNYDHFSPKK